MSGSRRRAREGGGAAGAAKAVRLRIKKAGERLASRSQ